MGWLKDLLEILFWIVGIIVGLNKLGILPMPSRIARFLKWGLVCVITLTVIQWIIINKTSLKASVDCNIWEIPACVEKDLKNVDNLRENLKSITDVNNKMCELHESQADKHVGIIDRNVEYDCNYIIDAKGMYFIVLQNSKWGSLAEKVAIAIPDANYIQVEQANGDVSDYQNYGRRQIKLGDIDPDNNIKIKAWTIFNASEPNAKQIKVVSRAGIAPLYVKTPVGGLAEGVNQYRNTIILPLGAIIIFCFFVAAAKKRQKYSESSVSPPQQSQPQVP